MKFARKPSSKPYEIIQVLGISRLFFMIRTWMVGSRPFRIALPGLGDLHDGGVVPTSPSAWRWESPDAKVRPKRLEKKNT